MQSNDRAPGLCLERCTTRGSIVFVEGKRRTDGEVFLPSSHDEFDGLVFICKGDTEQEQKNLRSSYQPIKMHEICYEVRTPKSQAIQD